MTLVEYLFEFTLEKNKKYINILNILNSYIFVLYLNI
jgi:hypothetical protein